MMSTNKRYYCGPELKERILACLFMNNGSIEDPTGQATRKLWRFMAGNATLSTVRSGLLALEEQQLVLRDIKGGHDTGPIRHAGSGCFGIFMVNQDDRPEEWAIAELQEQINHRLLAKASGAATQAKEANTRAAKAEAAAAALAAEPDPEPIDHLAMNGEDLVTDLATSLLAKVLAVIQAPPVEIIKRVPMETAEVGDLRRQLSTVQANLNTVVAACKDQEKELDKLRRENKDLKSQLGKHKGQGDHLTQQIRDVLTPEQLDALMRQRPQEGDDS